MRLCILLFAVVVATACGHTQSFRSERSSRKPAQVQMPTVSFTCPRGTRGDQEFFQISSIGEVDYHLETAGLPMGGRGEIHAQWISKNVVVLSGRRTSDAVCSAGSCEYSYFTVYLHRRTGSGLEVTTHYLHPEAVWRSESSSVSCRVEG